MFNFINGFEKQAAGFANLGKMLTSKAAPAAMSHATQGAMGSFSKDLANPLSKGSFSVSGKAIAAAPSGQGLGKFKNFSTNAGVASPAMGVTPNVVSPMGSPMLNRPVKTPFQKGLQQTRIFAKQNPKTALGLGVGTAGLAAGSMMGGNKPQSSQG